MRSEAEISKRGAQGIDFIINCAKGCASKPPGLYCHYCYRMWQDTELLSWVLERPPPEHLIPT